jgi:hypothetical protein
MASIITATTTSGLTQSADNSGVLQLASGAGNLVTVPAVTGTAMVSGNMPTFNVYRGTSNQSISSNTWTKVQLNAENWDTANAFDSTTNYRFQPTVAGYYQLSGTVTITGTSVTFVALEIRVNGNETFIGPHQIVPSQTGDIYINASVLAYLNGSTDYAELWGYATGSGLIFQSGSAYPNQIRTWFAGSLVRTA